MGWLIAAGVLVLLLVLPVGVRGIYDAAGFLLDVILGPVRIRAYPTSKDSAQKPQKQKTGNKEKSKEKKTGGSLSDFKPLVRLILTALNTFRQKLRVGRLELQLVLAGTDPCDVSLLYGRAWAIAGSVLPQLERVFVVKRRNIDISCDYTTQTPRVYARVDLTITVGRLLFLAMKHGFPILKEYRNIMNTRKGGAKL